MDQAKPVGRIDVISDAICPWCYIGKRHLESALALLDKQGLHFTVADAILSFAGQTVRGTFGFSRLDGDLSLSLEDGSVDFGQAPARHTYSGSGPYTVTLTTANGSCSSTATTTVYP